MSGASSWLQKMRKGELIELSDSVGFTGHDGMKKTELEVALDDYLTKNASQFSSDTQFAPFYKGRGGSSPVKKEASSAISDIETKVKSVKRRVTKAAEELVATDDSEVEPATTRSRSALTRTPRASALSNLSFASNVPLPPSPSVVADAIDRRTQVLRSKVANMYEDSGLVEYAQTTRESLSTVQAVQAVVILFEFYNLRKEVLADRYAFTIPVINYLTSAPYDVKIPDLFLLLTASFWNPVSLWAITTLVVPFVASYFFNLTAKPSRTRSHTPHFAYKFDPLTFSIAKALMTFVVFGQDVTFGGLVDLESVARINSAIYGGWKGVLTGTGITALITLYDAVLKK
ncbi:hypothetical protein DL95DRAFT_324623 [Leptodontidium sp. 2 PMI_412]|nr:hypothetical protein BKA61DRAFT_469058 [Leptodontidium sp. MPI-SDFR-AT-0119]KAH9223756.1 hypothetical protein DL95DRAFT_324623 [Leptodontidium sp. 2 PMI_412]